MAQLNKKSVDAIVKSVRKLNDEIIKLNKSHDELVADNVKAAEVNKKLKTTVDNLKKANDKLKKTDEGLSKAEKELLKSAAALEKQRQKGLTQLAKLEAKERALQKAATSQAKSIDDLKNKVKALTIIRDRLDRTTIEGKKKFDQLTTSIRRNRAELNKTRTTSSGLINVFKKQALAIGTMAAGFIGLTTVIRVFRDITRRIREFDKEMQNMAGIAGVSRKELKGVESAIKQVAGESIKTSNEVAKLATVLFTLGKTREEVILMLKPVNDLSIALNATSEETADFLGQTLNAFGEGAGSAQRFADIIANIRSSTALDFERIKESFGFIAPTAKALNITVGRTGALMGVLQDEGIKAARAGRLLNTSFASLIDKGLTLDDALNLINESTNKVKTASDLFGKRSFTLGLILADNIEKTNKLAAEFDNLSEGSLKRLTDEQLKSIDAQLKILDSTWERFILRVDSGNGVIGKTIRELVSLGIAILDSGKSFADIAIETSINATSDALSGLSQELIVVADSLQKGGLTSLEANKRAVDLLVLQYLKLQAEAGGVNDQINAQVDRLKELQAEYENTEEPIKANTETQFNFAKAIKETNKEIDDQIDKELELLDLEGDKEESNEAKKSLEETIALEESLADSQIANIQRVFDRRRELARLTIDNRNVLQSELLRINEEEIESDIERTEAKIENITEENSEKIRLQTELKELELELELNGLDQKAAIAEQEKLIDQRRIQSKFRYLTALRNVLGSESLLGKLAFTFEKGLAIASIWRNTGIANAKAVAASPLTLGQPWVSANTGSALASTALIASQVIKAFAKGTDGKFNTPDTFIAGEAGTEVVSKGGKDTIVDKATLFTGMKNSMVVSNPELKAMSTSKTVNYSDNTDVVKAINSGARETRKAIRGIRFPIQGGNGSYAKRGYTKKVI